MAASTSLRRALHPSRAGYVHVNGVDTKRNTCTDSEPGALGYLLKLCISAASGVVFGFAAEKARG